MPRRTVAKATMDDESLNGDRPEEDDERELTREPTDIALFIDWENLKWSLRDIGRVPNISSILDAARERGRVVVAKAYADWQHGGHHLDPPNLYRAGISPVYIPSRSGDGRVMKNSADIKLAVDTIDYSHTFPHVKTFVIVSGDADLVHLANYLRMQGKFVIAIGVSGASSGHLSDSVDEFLFYDVDIEPTAQRRVPARGGAQEKKALERMFNNLVTVVKREARDSQGVSFSGIANEMRHRYDFQPRRLGVSGFKQFMQEAENQGVIKIVTEGMQDFAYLPEHLAAIERQEEEEGAQTQQPEDEDTSVKLTDLDSEDLRRFIASIVSLESKSKYLRMPYVVANLRSSSTLPNLSRAQLKSLLKDALSQGVFTTGSREVKSHATGEPMELDTIELDRANGLVQEALREPAEAVAQA